MYFTTEAVYLLAMETAHLMCKEQLKFDSAFNKAFSKVGFDPEVRRAAKSGVGRIFNSWKKEKKERQTRSFLTGTKTMALEANEDICPLH